MTELTVQDRVAQGAAWLDVRYPGWFTGIDLSILDLGDCHQCILGQVYTGCIPAEERGQILAQVVRMHAVGSGGSEEDWRTQILEWGGFSVLDDFHDLPDAGGQHGFNAKAIRWDVPGREDSYFTELDTDYMALLDEWTRVIIQRRLDAHAQAMAEPSQICEPEKVGAAA